MLERRTRHHLAHALRIGLVLAALATAGYAAETELLFDNIRRLKARGARERSLEELQDALVPNRSAAPVRMRDMAFTSPLKKKNGLREAHCILRDQQLVCDLS